MSVLSQQLMLLLSFFLLPVLIYSFWRLFTLHYFLFCCFCYVAVFSRFLIFWPVFYALQVLSVLLCSVLLSRSCSTFGGRGDALISQLLHAGKTPAILPEIRRESFQNKTNDLTPSPEGPLLYLNGNHTFGCGVFWRHVPSSVHIFNRCIYILVPVGNCRPTILGLRIQTRKLHRKFREIA